MQLSPHFALSEFACRCRCGGEMKSEIRKNLETLCLALECIRKEVGKIVVVNSGYRCPDYNASPKVQGAPDSFHTKGMAADIVVPTFQPFQVRTLAQHVKAIGGIGHYDDFTHVDIRPRHNNRIAHF